MADLDALTVGITDENRHGETVVFKLVPKRVEEREESQAQIIEALERWLAEAKAGEFTQIAMVATHADGSISTCWRTFYGNAALQGALVNLTHRLAQEWNED